MNSTALKLLSSPRSLFRHVLDHEPSDWGLSTDELALAGAWMEEAGSADAVELAAHQRQGRARQHPAHLRLLCMR